MNDSNDTQNVGQASSVFSSGSAGRLPSARWCPSPNFNQRPANSVISLIVVHNISLPPGRYGGPHVERFFCNCMDPGDDDYLQSIASMQVSAHVFIRRDGEVVQFVDFGDRAWHAGRSSFAGVDECNDYGIGIELEGTDHEPYETVQYERLVQVCSWLMAQWPEISPDRITGHSDIAPGRKSDPGPAFDWARFRQMLAGDRGSQG